MKNIKRNAIYKIVWLKIRYWQRLHDIPNNELAIYMNVCERTLHEYDKDARNITLEKIDNFLLVNNMEITDLLSL